MNVFIINLMAGRHGSENRDLSAGVVAFHVGLRISLGIA